MLCHPFGKTTRLAVFVVDLCNSPLDLELCFLAVRPIVTFPVIFFSNGGLTSGQLMGSFTLLLVCSRLLPLLPARLLYNAMIILSHLHRTRLSSARPEHDIGNHPGFSISVTLGARY